jgi:hypothetical protein
MAKSTPAVGNQKVVGALFDDPINAQKAVNELIEEGFPSASITMIQQNTHREKPKMRRESIEERGFAESDVAYFDGNIEQGKTLVSVADVSSEETGKVIQILNKNGSHYNPDGSRSVRDDVVGMTSGAAVGAAVGAVVGGPVGAAVGGVAGAAVGGALGTKLEDSE